MAQTIVFYFSTDLTAMRRTFILILCVFLLSGMAAGQKKTYPKKKLKNETSIEYPEFDFILMAEGSSSGLFGLNVGILFKNIGFYSGYFPKIAWEEKNGPLVYDNHRQIQFSGNTSGIMYSLNKNFLLLGGLGFYHVKKIYLTKDFDAADWVAFIHDHEKYSNQYYFRKSELIVQAGGIFTIKNACFKLMLESYQFKSAHILAGFGIKFKTTDKREIEKIKDHTDNLH